MTETNRKIYKGVKKDESVVESLPSKKTDVLDRCDPIAYNNNNNLKIKKDIVASEYVIGDDKQVSGQGKTVETVLSDIEVDESDLTYKQKQERIITKY